MTRKSIRPRSRLAPGALAHHACDAGVWAFIDVLFVRSLDVPFPAGQLLLSIGLASP